MQDEIIKYLQSLTKDDALTIIKYGLRGSDVPEGVTVEDIFDVIGSMWCEEKL